MSSKSRARRSARRSATQVLVKRIFKFGYYGIAQVGRADDVRYFRTGESRFFDRAPTYFSDAAQLKSAVRRQGFRPVAEEDGA